MSNAKKRLGNSFDDFFRVRDDLYEQITLINQRTSGQGPNAIAGSVLSKVVSTFNMDIVSLSAVDDTVPSTSIMVVETNAGGTFNKITIANLITKFFSGSEAQNIETFSFFMGR